MSRAERPTVFEVRGEVGRELAQHARHELLHFGAEEAAVRVGDARQHGVDAIVRSDVDPLAVGDPGEQLGELASTRDLHGGHWPHDSTARKRVSSAATATMSAVSS